MTSAYLKSTRLPKRMHGILPLERYRSRCATLICINLATCFLVNSMGSAPRFGRFFLPFSFFDIDQAPELTGDPLMITVILLDPRGSTPSQLRDSPLKRQKWKCGTSTFKPHFSPRNKGEKKILCRCKISTLGKSTAFTVSLQHPIEQQREHDSG